MSKIGERLPFVSTSKTQTSPTGKKDVSTQQWVDLLGSVLPTQSVTKAAPASTFAAQAPGTSGTPQPPFGKEILPSALGPLRDERLAACVDMAFREVFKGDRWPSGPERSKWLDFARELRNKNPEITAEEVRYAIQDKLRLERDGLDAHSPANTDKFISEALAWVSQCYDDKAPPPTEADMQHWRAFAADLMSKNPKTTPEELKYAIIDAVRAKVLGTDAVTPENIDKFIQDAVKWVTQCYEDKEREATPAELKEWRAFAQEQLKKDPEISPEHLKYAITDAMRAKMTGTGEATPLNIDKFIEDGVKWVTQCYEGQERKPTTEELAHWRDFARKHQKENPDITPEALKFAIQDAIRVKATGMDSTGSTHIDKFIQDAVKWVAFCYEGQERDATPEEMRRWRAFANEKKKENKDISPEELKYAIQDAMRSEKMGTDAPASNRIEDHIRAAYGWLMHINGAGPSQPSSEPTPNELHEWKKFAEKKLQETPEMTSEELRYYILDSLRTAIANS
ncbi:hypothetical protein [Myxococcus xanthus]|uniref:hypothetical protein n=1 Tax=Myxococcus xanthus TaxID=34 RepID=UPI00112B1500|nr:hypothetical protein [Myxococcus xanthus]QDF00352.1 hypothetical protein BHS05_33445 [Myxococcus xanthus]